MPPERKAQPMQGDTLDLIRALREALHAPATEAAFHRWRAMATSIDSSLQWNAAYSVAERKLMERLREGLAGLLSACNAAREPDFSRAIVPLTALESLVRGRLGVPPSHR